MRCWVATGRGMCRLVSALHCSALPWRSSTMALILSSILACGPSRQRSQQVSRGSFHDSHCSSRRNTREGWYNSMASENILEVRNLSVDYASDTGTVHAVDNVSFVVKRGEIFGLAGESGSGKSTLAFALARLLKFPAKITKGEIIFNFQPDRQSPQEEELFGDSV